MKRCSNCGLFKGPSDFHRDSEKRDGYKSQCKSCRSEKDRERFRLWGKKRHLGNRRKTKYGVSAHQVAQIKAEQGQLCAICKEPLGKGREAHIDHDHQTGRVRGVLCHGCNVGLGFFRDNTVSLKEAIAYLGQSHPSTHDPRLFSSGEDGAA